MDRKDVSPLAAALGIGAALVFGAVAVFRSIRSARSASDPAPGEHVPTDLMRPTHPGPDDRAIPAFRPDPTAPVPPDERDAFRPALEQPTLVEGQADDIPRRAPLAY